VVHKQIHQWLDSKKNGPLQTAVERYIQIRACKFIDEIVPYTSEEDLEGILKSFKNSGANYWI
jgi:glycerol-3-phosphate cytidylyltransferase-like family protein